MLNIIKLQLTWQLAKVWREGSAMVQVIRCCCSDYPNVANPLTDNGLNVWKFYKFFESLYIRHFRFWGDVEELSKI